MNTGKVVQVMGPVVDVIFESGDLPEIFTALEIITEATGRIICEVQQHMGENTVRTLSMGATDGLSRGIEVKDLGTPIRDIPNKWATPTINGKPHRLPREGAPQCIPIIFPDTFLLPARAYLHVTKSRTH